MRKLSKKKIEAIRAKVKSLMPVRPSAKAHTTIESALQNTGVGRHQDLRIAEARLKATEARDKAREMLKK